MLTRDLPLMQLATMVDDLSTKYITSLIKTAQRGAWYEYRDNRQYPGAAFRFSRQAKQAMGFSYRSAKHLKRKGNLPDYHFTGAMKASILQRQPKTSVAGNVVTTWFSIFGGAMNFLGAKHGSMNQANGKGLVTRTAHTRRGKFGKSVSVRSYQQRGFIRGAPSGKSYAEEWAYRPDEVAWVGRRTDELGTALYNATVFDKKGNLKTNPRVGKAALKKIIGAE